MSNTSSTCTNNNMAEDTSSTNSNSRDSLSSTSNAFIFPEEVENILKAVDEYFSRFPRVLEFCQYTSLRPSHLFFLLSFICITLAGYGFGSTILLDTLRFYYPAWNSYKAVESSDTSLLKKNLTYWVVVSFLNFFDYVFKWIPFWYLIKFTLSIYLAIPYFEGSRVIYNQVIRKFLRKHQHKIESMINNSFIVLRQLITSALNYTASNIELESRNNHRHHPQNTLLENRQTMSLNFDLRQRRLTTSKS